MDKATKTAIAVALAIIMLVIAAYLTVTTVSRLVLPPRQGGPVEPTEPAGTPMPTNHSTFFNFQK